jgi:hypothetical protein
MPIIMIQGIHMSKKNGLGTKTIHAFIMRKALGANSSPLAVTLLGQTACLSAHGFYGALAFWDGRFLNIPAPIERQLSLPSSVVLETKGDMARLLLQRVVTRVHGTAQWEAIEPVAPVFSGATMITWPAKNREALRLPYPFIFDAKDLVIVAPDVQAAFLRAPSGSSGGAYVRILKALGGTIAPTRREEIARKISLLR